MCLHHTALHRTALHTNTPAQVTNHRHASQPEPFRSGEGEHTHMDDISRQKIRPACRPVRASDNAPPVDTTEIQTEDKKKHRQKSHIKVAEIVNTTTTTPFHLLPSIIATVATHTAPSLFEHEPSLTSFSPPPLSPPHPLHPSTATN